MNRGGLAELLVALVAPGLDARRRHRRLGVALLLIGLAAPIVWLAIEVFRHDSWVGLGLDRNFLLALIVVLCVAVVTRVIAVAELLRAHRGSPGAGARLGVSAIGLLAIVVPSAVGADTAADARHDIDAAFDDTSDEPIFDAAAPSSSAPEPPPATRQESATEPDSTPTTAPSRGPRPHTEVVPIPHPSAPRRPDSGVDPAALDDVTTVLLLGGDAGPGRSGLRTDSMILVSVHRPSGRAALISVPRNLERLLFPPGSAMADRYPDGFTEIANAVYPIVSNDESLRGAYSGSGVRPGAAAIAEGIGYSLDVTIDDYVLIDMQGFVEVIDALGGVTVDVPKAVPTPGNPPGAAHPVPEVIPAGEQHMDGTTALAYVRSRKADSDYYRVARQRLVLAALARQVSLTDALTGYSAVVSALGDSLRTSLTTDAFVELLGLIGGETAIVESVGLVPPLVRPENPDYDAMAKVVGAVQMAIVNGTDSGY